jgi:hypothetical protein
MYLREYLTRNSLREVETIIVEYMGSFLLEVVFKGFIELDS